MGEIRDGNRDVTVAVNDRADEVHAELAEMRAEMRADLQAFVSDVVAKNGAGSKIKKTRESFSLIGQAIEHEGETYVLHRKDTDRDPDSPWKTTQCWLALRKTALDKFRSDVRNAKNAGDVSIPPESDKYKGYVILLDTIVQNLGKGIFVPGREVSLAQGTLQCPQGAVGKIKGKYKGEFNRSKEKGDAEKEKAYERLVQIIKRFIERMTRTQQLQKLGNDDAISSVHVLKRLSIAPSAGKGDVWSRRRCLVQAVTAVCQASAALY